MELLAGRLNVACKRSQGRGQIGPTAGLLNETNAFKGKTNQDQTKETKENQIFSIGIVSSCSGKKTK